MSWKEISIGELGQVITGNTPPKSNPEFYGKDYRFIKPTDMEIGQRYTPITEDYYSEIAYKKYIKSLIPPLSTCVVTIGSIGKKMTLTDDYSFVNQAVNAVIPDVKKYDPFFVFYALKNILHKVKSADTGASSGRENVSKSNFMSLKLNVPEHIETQRKIGQILSSFDDLIENNLKRIKLLEETAQNIYKEWFVNFRFPNYEHTEFNTESGLPVGWEEMTVKEYCEIVSRGATLDYLGDEALIPVINQSCVRNGELELEKIRYACPLKETKEYSYLKLNDILINSMGDGTLGRVSKNNTIEDKYIIHNCITFLRAKPNYSQSMLYGFISTKQDYFITVAQGSTGQSTLNLKLINELKLNVPTKIILNAFDNFILPIWQTIGTLKMTNQKLKEARDIMLPRLMNRTIEV